jgi:NADPH:quinone reductase-like Zn-dependent oxidoreductase
LDIAAYRPFSDYKPILRPTGKYVLVGGSLGRIFRALLFAPFASMRGTQKFGNLSQKPNHANLVVMSELLEAGKVVSVIDRCYPLEETAEAFRYFGSGRTQGKIVIVVEQHSR